MFPVNTLAPAAFMTRLRPVRTDVTRAEAEAQSARGGSHRILAEGRGRR
jgi:hypothetical protein